MKQFLRKIISKSEKWKNLSPEQANNQRKRRKVCEIVKKKQNTSDYIVVQMS